jgi:2-polyprenyl-3-methyl-5-hydroxy-6-metoxy-1,4-benzoquinol methylase
MVAEAVARRPWSEERVREMLATRDFHYQRIPLPYGLATAGNDRSSTAERIFPPDLRGKSVFDLGCMNGYFAFEAERRGAATVVGGEIDARNVETCELLADCIGSRAAFLRMDIERDPMPGRFDYVLCLNVLHHMRNPLAALDRLIEATRECLVLELATLSLRDTRKLGPWALALSPLIKSLPVLYLGGANARAAASQTYFLTESAVRTLLTRHRQDFAGVEIVRGGQKGRFIAIARKRRIGHLHIVAGVNAVGKSTLLDGIAAGRHRDIAAGLGLLPFEQWRQRLYGKLAADREPEAPHLLLHYNISKHLIDGDLHQHQRGLLDIVRCAEKVTVTTLWHPAAELHRRYVTQRFTPSGIERFNRRARKKARKLLEVYGSADALNALYGDWADFVARHCGEHRFVVQEPDYRILTAGEWRTSLPRARAGAGKPV